MPGEQTRTDSSVDANYLDSQVKNEALKMLFNRYPNLRDRLYSVYSMTLEPPSTYVKEPQEIYSVPKKREARWTQERADQKALKALHNVLTEEDTNGFEEFARLVDTYLVDVK